MTSGYHSDDAAFSDAAKFWNLTRLYLDLEEAIQKKLTPTDKIRLQGLLLGRSPKAIAETLHLSSNGLGVYLSNVLYRYIEQLTQQKVKNWREVAAILEQAYRLPAASPASAIAMEHSIASAGLASSPPGANHTNHNLPSQDFRVMIGREQEMGQLLEMLSYNHPVHCISLEGMGGMGKTTLALAAAYHCLEVSQPGFDAVIFFSAQQHRLTAHGILPRLQPDRTLRDLFRAIARTLHHSNLLLTDFNEQLGRVQEILSRQRTLLIVDNLDSVEDYQTILAFLYDLPATVKVILTSRQQTPFDPIALLPLSEWESLQLIQHQAQRQRVLLNSQEIQLLYQGTSGIPAAIVYAIGQIKAGYPLKDVSTRLTKQGDYTRFYFESSVSPLRGSLSHALLMALALFTQPALEEAIATIANSSGPDHLDGFAQLQQLSLVQCDQGRYRMLPLTREFALAELAAHPRFEQTARERWIHWYLGFVQKHGGKDWKEWNHYRDLEQEWDNLQDAIEWCMITDRYDAVQQFWRHVKCYTHTQGYRINRLTYWDTRLDWTDWLIQAATQQQDWSTLLEVILDQGWTLTLLGQPQYFEQAAALYAQAWQLRNHKTVTYHVDLAIQIATLQIEQQRFQDAMQWLEQARVLLTTERDLPDAKRQWLQLFYDEGEICYKTADYPQAQGLFQKVLQQAEQLNWQRAIFLAKDWLADIAIQQGNLEEAEALVQEGLQMAENYQDDCRMAFCQRSLATLEKARGNEAIARDWAEEAQQIFLQLGMVTEAEETAVLLRTLENKSA